MIITLSPEYQNKLDALTSELGSLEAYGLSSTSVIEHLVDTVFYNAFGTKDNFTDAVAAYVRNWNAPLLSLELAAAELELSCIARTTLSGPESTPST